MATKLLMLTLPLLLAAPAAYSGITSFQAALVRTEPGLNFTRAVQRSRSRLSMLASRAASGAGGAASAQTPLRQEPGDYIMAFGIGTPATVLWAEADTGSDLIWAKCGACRTCTPQGSPSYDHTTSSSSSFVACGDPACGDVPKGSRKCDEANHCSYHYAYGDPADSHHYTEGILMTETFAFGDAALPGIEFGCTLRSEGGYGQGSGLVGLGRGKLSLVTQLNVEAFSYRLSSAPSLISFGSLASLTAGSSSFLSTPLLGTPDLTFYYVGLSGISIGGKLVEIPPGTFAMDANSGRGGVLFDSGSTMTSLVDPAYTLVWNELLAQMGVQASPSEKDDVCFWGDTSRTTFPSMVLHFDGGADMELPIGNYFPLMEGQNGVRGRCWSVLRSQDMTIIGNVMQRDFLVLYDLTKNSRMMFQPPAA